MAKKSQKNSKHVADLINSATLPALSLLAQVDKFAFLGVLDATKPEHQARSDLLDGITSVKREDITIADQEAVRLLQLVRFRTDLLQLLARAQAVGADNAGIQPDIFFQEGDPDFEEFIQVAAEYAQEFESLQQRQALVFGLRQDAPVEFQERQFTIEIMYG